MTKARRSGFLTKIEVVSRQATAQTDYQVQVEDILSRKGDGEDITFFQKQQILNHWKESYASWKSDVWAKLLNLPVTKSQILNVLSGNPSASSASNGTNTFELFDDFEGGERVNITNANFNSKEDDGTALSTGASGEWDYHIRGELGNVVYDPGNPIGGDYIMVYSGYAGAYVGGQCKVGIAYSTDRKTWTKYTGNPVISSPWTEDLYLVKNGSTYYLYGEDDGNVNIQLWTSTNLVDWTLQGNVLTPSASGYDKDYVGSQIVWIEGSTWHMLYEGLSSTNANGCVIAHATSADGISWAKDGSNPVMDATDTSWASGSGISGGICPNDIYKSGSTYYFLYIGYHSSTWDDGLATSTNLTSWTDSANSPIGAGNVYILMLNGGEDYLLSAKKSPSDSGIFLTYPYHSASLDTGKFEKTHSVPTSIIDGVLKIEPPDATYHYYVRTKNTFAYPIILEERWKYMTGGPGWRAYFAADIDVDATGLWGVIADAWDWAGGGSFSGASPAIDTWYRATTKMQTSVFNVSMNDGAITGSKSGLSTSSPQKVNIGGAGVTADIRVGFVFLRKYASPEPLIIKRKISGKCSIIKSVCGGMAS